MECSAALDRPCMVRGPRWVVFLRFSRAFSPPPLYLRPSRYTFAHFLITVVVAFLVFEANKIGLPDSARMVLTFAAAVAPLDEEASGTAPVAHHNDAGLACGVWDRIHVLLMLPLPIVKELAPIGAPFEEARWGGPPLPVALGTAVAFAEPLITCLGRPKWRGDVLAKGRKRRWAIIHSCLT